MRRLVLGLGAFLVASAGCRTGLLSPELGDDPRVDGDSGLGSEDAPLAAADGAPERLYAVQIAAGADHTCARMEDTTLRCWGKNETGQLGSSSSVSSTFPVFVGDLSGATLIAAGGEHTCARLGDGTLQCWGRDFDGELGDGSRSGALSPRIVPGARGFEELSLGFSHSCARSAGVAYCWGQNVYRELGDGSDRDQPVPARVVLPYSVVEIAVGEHHSCAITAERRVFCWGNNDHGQLGNGGTDRVLGIVEVHGLEGPTHLSLGRAHSCALDAGGAVQCWGGNDVGQLGTGVTGAPQTKPVTVVGLPTSVTQLVLGAQHACALAADREVYCWGSNEWGALGDTTSDNRARPVKVVWGSAGVVIHPDAGKLDAYHDAPLKD